MAQWIKDPPAMQETQETWVQSLGGKVPQRRKWQSTPVFLPEKFHGQRSLADTTKHTRYSSTLICKSPMSK